MIRFIIMNIISNHNIYCKSNTLLPAYLLWGQKKVYFSIWLTQHAETSFRNFLSASNQVIFKSRATHLYTQFRSSNCQVATVFSFFCILWPHCPNALVMIRPLHSRTWHGLVIQTLDYVMISNFAPSLFRSRPTHSAGFNRITNLERNERLTIDQQRQEKSGAQSK